MRNPDTIVKRYTLLSGYVAPHERGWAQDPPGAGVLLSQEYIIGRKGVVIQGGADSGGGSG